MNKPANWILLAASLVLHVESSQGQWTRIGQPGAEVFSLAVFGDTVFGVGSKGRIVFSTDSGESWTPNGLGTSNGFYPLLYKISIFPEVSLIGMEGGGIAYKRPHSYWNRSGEDSGTDDILAFVESRGDTTVTYLAGGFGGGIRIGSFSGTASNLSWEPSNSGLLNLNVTSLASGPTLPDRSGQLVFAGTYGGGVFASTNNGQSWTSTGEGLSALQINAMEVSGDRLYVAGCGGRVFASSDWGEHWEQMGTSLPNTEILSIAAVDDGSTEWLYVGTIDAGVWRCPAACGLWFPMNGGLENLRINAIVEKAGALFVGTHDGISRSWDGGATWTRVTDAASPRLNALHAVPPSASDGEDLLVTGTAAVYFRGNCFVSSVFSSENQGMNWRVTGPKFNGAVLSFADHDGLLFFLGSGTGDVCQGAGMSISSDMGSTWEWSYDENNWSSTKIFSCMEIVPAKDQSRIDCFVACAIGPPELGVFSSSDTGHSWIRISDKRARAMVSVGPYLLVRDPTGVYRTSDYGVTWDTVTSHLAGNEVISFAGDGDRLLACISYDPANSRPGGVLVSTDAGDTWLPAGLEGTTVASLLSLENCLLAVANGKIYACLREELRWVDVTSNLLGAAAGKLTATSKFCYVLGADGKSIWKRSMKEILDDVSIPVPIQLASFTGRLQKNCVQLEWSTLSEVNNYGFYVQRKRGKESVWTELPNSFTAGHGTTTEPQHYSFTDAPVPDSSSSYRLKQVDLDGTRHFSEPIQVSVVTSVQEQHPPTFALYQNHPNPFNPTTVVSYQLPVASNVRLIVYDVLGRDVAVLVDEKREAGYHEVKFDGSGRSSGLYFYRLQVRPLDSTMGRDSKSGAGVYVETKKFVLTK